MKTSLFVALVVTILLSCWAYGDDSTTGPNWQPVYGLKYDLKIFVDNSSLGHHEIEDGDFNVGSLLIVFPEVTTITPKGGKKFAAKSMVKNFVVDCKTGAMGQIKDVYYSVDKPTLDDKPVQERTYSDTSVMSEDIVMVGKNHPFRLALCPIFT